MLLAYHLHRGSVFMVAGFIVTKLISGFRLNPTRVPASFRRAKKWARTLITLTELGVRSG